MASPLSVNRNNYRENPKRSDIYTPPGVASFLYETLRMASPLKRRGGPSAGGGRCVRNFATILDPAIGTGQLTQPWWDAGHTIIGCDIVSKRAECHKYYHSRYEDLEKIEWTPGLVVCNAPFNGAAGRKLYPEVFLEHTFKLFGIHQPIVLFTPMGMRLNQRRKSSRWRSLRDCGAELTSIISLPLDIFPGVEFHSEILMFNLRGVKPHYFLPENAL
ncbi:MAG: hypothetical protein ABFC88_12595 [Thermoguttaceae bacterium]